MKIYSESMATIFLRLSSGPKKTVSVGLLKVIDTKFKGGIYV